MDRVCSVDRGLCGTHGRLCLELRDERIRGPIGDIKATSIGSRERGSPPTTRRSAISGRRPTVSTSRPKLDGSVSDAR